MKFFLTTITIGFLALCPLVSASAQGLGNAMANVNAAANTKTTGLSDNLSGTVGLAVKGALALVGTIFLLLTIYAGILWMTASGKEEQIETAQKIIKSTIIGLFITMAAYAITFFVTSRLSGVGGATTTAAPNCSAIADEQACNKVSSCQWFPSQSKCGPK